MLGPRGLPGLTFWELNPRYGEVGPGRQELHFARLGWTAPHWRRHVGSGVYPASM
jgi:hypothetical protein